MRYSLPIKVLILTLIFFTAEVALAQTPRVFFSSHPKQIYEGERMSIDVKIDSNIQAINAVSGSINFPENLVSVTSVSKEGSFINLWIKEPSISRGKISFEGVSFNPGFRGYDGKIFRITFEAKRSGNANIRFIEGAVLANDGLGTNVLATLGNTSFTIATSSLPAPTVAEVLTEDGEVRLTALPVIVEYSPLATAKDGIFVKGKGEPNALTKIVFRDVSAKSLGEQLISYLQTERKKLDEVLVKNSETGEFDYFSPKNLVAGVYNATPFLVDETTNTEKPGFGVELLVDDSQIVKWLVVLINVLGLMIPIVALGVIIYFIPWYSFKRMRVLKRQMGLEEEKLILSEHQLKRQDKADKSGKTL